MSVTVGNTGQVNSSQSGNSSSGSSIFICHVITQSGKEEIQGNLTPFMSVLGGNTGQVKSSQSGNEEIQGKIISLDLKGESTR